MHSTDVTCNKVDSFEFPGLSGMDKMSALMQGLRDKPLTEIAGHADRQSNRLSRNQKKQDFRQQTY